jgi:1-hydroxycarotenoid 3,4-desaturase
MRAARVIVIGAGVGGLVTALELARRGLRVTLLEQAQAPGGKMREVDVAGAKADAGPTVLTMRPVLEEIFAAAGSSLESELELVPAGILARHAWSAEEQLDLHADPRRAAEAIGTFAGAREARGYLSFCAHARRIYQTLEQPFMRASRPSLLGLVHRAGWRGLLGLCRIQPFTTLWQALGEHFHDPRLRQLFGRYATYCGSSPFLAPATLMLVAHVEQEGVWMVRGGMQRVAEALARRAAAHGASLRYGACVAEVLIRQGRAAGVRLDSGEELPAEAVVVNADSAAVAGGKLGASIARTVPLLRPGQRSLSALTWVARARTRGFPLLRHNVFFSSNYAAEFADIFGQRRLPAHPTVYVCAQDRDERDEQAPHREARAGAPERLLVLVNAPPDGDRYPLDPLEIARCEKRAFSLLEHCGLQVARDGSQMHRTTPTDFERMFPGTGGALYGPASHGWMASFRRPDARTRMAGLYLAGGSTHPGPGVPMAALSGRLAAAALYEDLALTSRSRRVAMPGGTSTPSAMTGATD